MGLKNSEYKVVWRCWT